MLYRLGNLVSTVMTLVFLLLRATLLGLSNLLIVSSMVMV